MYIQLRYFFSGLYSSSLRVTLNSSQLKKQEKDILPAPIFHIRQTESLEKIVNSVFYFV